MKNIFPKFFIGLSLFISAFGLSAQTIFDVELVFFKRIGDLHLKGQPEPVPLEAEDVEYYLSSVEAALPEGYTLLARSEQKLEGVYHRLRASSDMRPLLHIGWRQELQDKADTPWLSFSVTDEPEQTGLEGFNGIIRLSRNQGLVLESQVVGYKEPTQPLIDQSHNELAQSAPDDAQESDLDLPFDTDGTDADTDNLEQTNTEFSAEEHMQMPDQLSGFFEMSETLKVKLGDLYYIDHPTMGLLVKVTPYQATIEEQEALN